MIRIHKWSETFENSDTRKRQRLGWFLAPSSNDSKGYRRLMKHGEEGVLALGVYQALCQLTATNNAKNRGEFIHSDGTPMDLEDLADLLRMPEEVISKSLPLLGGVGWITEVGSRKNEENAPTGRNLPPTAESLPPTAGFVKGEGEGEGEGEGKGKGEGEESPPPLPEEAFRFCQSAMIPATMEIVEAWRSDRASMGWEKPKGQTMVPIVNWREDLRGFVRAWKNNENKDNGRRNNSPRGNQDGPGSADYSDTEGLKLA